METIIIYIGMRTPRYKKDFCENFFNRLGYLVHFQIKKYLVASIEIDKDLNEKLPQKYLGLFNFCLGLQVVSFSRLQKIRVKQLNYKS